MERKRIKVDCAFITPGMYVAQLDRSWLESPFSSHGFEIQQDSEIQLLRKFCKYVYVDIPRSSVEMEQIMQAQSRAVTDPFMQTALRMNGSQSPADFGGKLRGLFSWLGLAPSPPKSNDVEKHVRPAVAVRKEIPNAAAVYGQAMAKMHELLGDVKGGKGVNVDKLRESVSPVVDSVLKNPDAMSWLCYLADPIEGNYCLSMPSAVRAVILGRHLGFDKYALGNLAMGGALLNIGHANIPKSIVMKEGPPTSEETEILRMHVEYGLNILRTVPGLNDDIISMVACHHERHDGSGYPHGLTGADIPIFGRIAGIVACYDDMISRKPYGEPKSSYDAMCALNSMAGKEFQSEAIKHFVLAIGMFPTGSLVGLNTGEVAIVIEQNPVNRLRPKLMLVLDKDKGQLSSGKKLDLAKVPNSGTKRKARWIVKGYELGAFEIDPNKYFLE